MKKILITLVLMAAWVSVSFAAVRFVGKESNTVMVIEKGFSCPYQLELSYQEGVTFTAADMGDVAEFKVYFTSAETADSTTCAACFDSTTYQSTGIIVVDFASMSLAAGSGTATMFADGRKIGTFQYTISESLSAATGLTP